MNGKIGFFWNFYLVLYRGVIGEMLRGGGWRSSFSALALGLFMCFAARKTRALRSLRKNASPTFPPAVRFLFVPEAAQDFDALFYCLVLRAERDAEMGVALGEAAAGDDEKIVPDAFLDEFRARAPGRFRFIAFPCSSP